MTDPDPKIPAADTSPDEPDTGPRDDDASDTEDDAATETVPTTEENPE